MGDGGDGGGEAVDYSAAELPVDWASEVVEAAAAAPDEEFEDGIVLGGTGGDAPWRTREEDELIDLTWVEPDTRSSTA